MEATCCQHSPVSGALPPGPSPSVFGRKAARPHFSDETLSFRSYQDTRLPLL